MSQSGAVDRRYWIIGILCSLALHGLLLLLPLRLASVQPTISRTLRVGLVEQAASEPENSAQNPPAFSPKTQEPVSAKKRIPQQTMKPEQAANTVAGASEEKSFGSETATMSGEKSEEMLAPPIFMPADVAGHESVRERPRDESAVVGTAAAEFLALSASVSTAQSSISGPDLYQEQQVLQKSIDIAEVLAGSPSGSVSGEKPVESSREHTSPVMTSTKSSAGITELEEASAGAPSAPQPVIPEVVESVAAKKSAETGVVAAPNEVPSRQYFAASDGLFAHTQSVEGASLSSTKKSDNVSASQADSSDTQMAFGTNIDSQTDLVAEKNAERKALYNGKNEKGESAKIARAVPEQSTREGLGFEQKGVASSSDIPNVEGHQIQRVSMESPDSAVAVGVQSGKSEKSSLKTVENKEVPVEMAGEPVEIAQASPQSQPQQKMENLSSTPSLPSTAPSDSIASVGTPEEKTLVAKESDQSVAIQTQPQSPRKVEAAPAIPGPAPADSVLPHFDTVEALSQRILAALSIRKEYPAAALKRRTEGVVKLSIDVAPNGSLVVARIQARSGSAILDGAALKLVQSIFPLDVRLASAVSLVVPVEYRIPK